MLVLLVTSQKVGGGSGGGGDGDGGMVISSLLAWLDGGNAICQLGNEPLTRVVVF